MIEIRLEKPLIKGTSLRVENSVLLTGIPGIETDVMVKLNLMRFPGSNYLTIVVPVGARYNHPVQVYSEGAGRREWVRLPLEVEKRILDEFFQTTVNFVNMVYYGDTQATQKGTNFLAFRYKHIKDMMDSEFCVNKQNPFVLLNELGLLVHNGELMRKCTFLDSIVNSRHKGLTFAFKEGRKGKRLREPELNSLIF